MQSVIDQKPSLKIDFEPFQSGFIESKARYPAFVAGWGTGKTMCAIAKGLELSVRYPGNLGLIARKKFTDLRDSTMKDFERYTGMHVPQSTKEVTIPGTNSVIMFRHAEELSGLQNVNLGWYYLEQAEEFDTDEQFQMLRGRLRREGCFRQGMIIANKNGHNWVWKIWEKDRKPGYEFFEANSFDNIDNLPADFIDDLRKMERESPRKFKRYVMNSSDEYDIEGAYYAAKMSDVLSQKRSGIKNLYDSHAQVYTFWDLGVQDLTVIWAVQFIGKEIHIINYYENSGEGLEHYTKKLQEWGYNYAEHWLPQDVKARMQGKDVQTRLNILQNLLINKGSIRIIEPHRVIDRIEEVWGILDECWFDEKVEPGVDALAHYQKRKNESLSTEDKIVFTDTPLHDWASHPADGFGYMAMAYRYQIVISGQRIGYPHPIPANAYADSSSGYDHNALNFGRRKR